MLKKTKIFHHYPLSTVLITNLASLSIYAIGLYFLYQLNFLLFLLYIPYILYLEFSLFKQSCTCCWYYNKVCAFGKGKIAPLFFKKDGAKKFCQREITWGKMLPQMLTFFIPIITGIILLIKSFNLIILILMLIPAMINFMGNPIIYGQLACPHCQQGKICCPANDFFTKMTEKKKKK